MDQESGQQLNRSRYRWIDKEAGNTGRQIERREVDFAVKGDYDPSVIPPEWVSWLHKFRKEPPSEEETKKYASDFAKSFQIVCSEYNGMPKSEQLELPSWRRKSDNGSTK